MLHCFFERENDFSSETIASVITVVSTLSAMWGCMILMNASAPILTRYPIKRLFTMLQLLLILSNLQAAVFKILAANGVILGDGIMGPGNWAKSEIMF